jgi:hypothetical protein
MILITDAKADQPAPKIAISILSAFLKTESYCTIPEQKTSKKNRLFKIMFETYIFYLL